MTPAQIALVQKSLEELPPQATAEMFYERLFELAPQLESLFKTDRRIQGEKLMGMLSAAVNGLGQIESIVPIVQELGRRHAQYGVELVHYEVVGTALLWTLEQVLEDGFSPAVEQAWIDAYELLSSTMTDAAYQEAA